MSNSLQPHRLQQARSPCPSSAPGVYSNSCPLSWWCHPTISSSVIPFSSSLQSFPASGSFPMSRLWIRWPKCWRFSFSISHSNEYSGLISFKADWLDLLSRNMFYSSIVHLWVCFSLTQYISLAFSLLSSQNSRDLLTYSIYSILTLSLIHATKVLILLKILFEV